MKQFTCIKTNVPKLLALSPLSLLSYLKKKTESFKSLLKQKTHAVLLTVLLML